MAQGRPRLPDNVKLFTGTLEKSRVIPNQPKPTRCIPEPPAYLGDAERAIWTQMCIIQDQMQLMTSADIYVIEMFAQAWVMRQRLWGVIETKGYSYETTNPSGDHMQRPIPEVVQLLSVNKEIMALMSKMGLSPSDRSRISVVIGDNDRDSQDFSEFA